MAHFHIKRKNGRPYLYVREIARVEGKPKVISQVYIGSPDKVAALSRGEGAERRLKVEEFGALWAAARMDEGVDLAGIVDEVIPRAARERGPSLGEYFLYCVLNRMCDPRSKRALPDWYERTAVSQIRPVDTKALTSQRYWEKWDRVSEADLAEISRRFFRRIWELEGRGADCLLFDTTNYYTYMSYHNPSELARRGKNKEGRHHLRQVGLGLLVSRDRGLPVFMTVYPGNLNDARLFSQVAGEMLARVRELDPEAQLTLVIDKGMNSPENFRIIDAMSGAHFVTTLSPLHVRKLASSPLSAFSPLDPEAGEGLMALRSSDTFWGRERAVVVTHNPKTARKQDLVLEGKISRLRAELSCVQTKVRQGQRHWRSEERVRAKHESLAKSLHLPPDLFRLSFERHQGALRMRFRLDRSALAHLRALHGRNVIVSDNLDWSTAEIVQASLDRWKVEDSFRQSKDEQLVTVQPLRHFTDSKIACQLFCCVAALAYLKRLEFRLAEAGVHRTARDAMHDLKDLHSVLSLTGRGKAPQRRLETPTKSQAQLLAALGYRIDGGGALQPLTT